MGMLGHQARPPAAGAEEGAVAPEVDKVAAEIASLEAELNVEELAAEQTGMFKFRSSNTYLFRRHSGLNVHFTNPTHPSNVYPLPPYAALDRRFEIAAAIRSRLDPLIGQSGASHTLLRATLHGITQSLAHVPPNFDAALDSPENKFRSSIVELLGRIPFLEIPKPSIPEVLHACHRVLETDHEDNGVIVQRVLFDIHKGYKGGLEEQTAPFFKWLESLFSNLAESANAQLEAAGKEGGNSRLVPAQESLKITIDVALMVFYLMQAYPKRMLLHGPALVPLMVKVVSLPGPNKEDVPASASSVYSDFRLAQIKTLAFMIVVSRAPQMAPLLAPHQEEVCAALIRIMETVPDVLATRKELLTCMRNMLNTPFKSGLKNRMDALLNERTLLGTDPGCINALKQLAYMNLAELVAVTKADLSQEQLERVVKLYTRNALDALNPTSLQTTSLRLLYNVIEVLFARRNRSSPECEAYRNMLSSILQCMVAKLGALRRQIPGKISDLRDMEDARKHRKDAEAAAAADSTAAGKKALQENKKKTEAAGAKAKAEAEAKANEERAAAEKAAAEAAAAAAAAAAATAAGGGVEGVKQEGDAPAAGAEPMATDANAPAAPAAAAPPSEVKPEPMEAEAAAGTAAAAPAAPPATAAATPSEQPEKEQQQNQQEGEEEKGEEEKGEEAKPAGPPPTPFRVLLQSAGAGSTSKEREMLDFRQLLHTVLNCLKNVLFITIAFHTNRGLQQPITFPIKPWSTRPADVRAISHILTYGLPAISFFEQVSPPGFDAREALADLFTAITDPRELTDIFAPRMNFLFDLVLANKWYMRFMKHLIDGEPSAKALVNRYALANLLRFLVAEKLPTMDDTDSPEGKLTLELLEFCFEMMPRIQALDIQKYAQYMQHHQVPTVERVLLPHIITYLRASFPKVAAGGPAAMTHMRAMRTLFFSLAVTNKFTEIQAAVGSTGLHLRIVDSALSLMQGPSTRTKEAEEAAAELCLLVPARLEHLIPVLPRMMHAVVLALNGSDRSVHVALRVLDVWVESFNPEFIERSMAAVTKPLMAALWSHIRPPPHPFGSKVAEMLGKMGGRGRRWLVEGTSVEFKAIPEYGLRVILAFPPHTSFLVPLDRCVQLAWTTVDSGTADVHRRKNALRLLQICVGTLARLHLPSDMVKTHSLPSAPPAVSDARAAAGAAGGGGPGATAGAGGAAAAADGAVPQGGEANAENIAGAAAAAGTEVGGDVPMTDAAAPPAPQPTTTTTTTSEAPSPELVDDALARLQALLFGNGPTPEIPSELNWPQELGVKTKKQHAAERQMLETVLTALMSSAAVDSELEGAHAKEFAHATCRHFALLMAAGWANASVRLLSFIFVTHPFSHSLSYLPCLLSTLDRPHPLPLLLLVWTATPYAVASPPTWPR